MMGKNPGGGERTGPSRRGRLRSQVLETPVEEMEGLLERLSDEYPSLERVDETDAEEAIEAEGEMEEEERDEDSWDEDSEYGAEELGVSNSTVVRLVKGATLQAPGIRWAPLGDLFNFSRKGYPVARRSIAQEIRRIIAGEDGRKPYSAREIAAQLRARVEAATGKAFQISEKMVRNIMDGEDIPPGRSRQTQDR